jgi:hypothetical protein
MGVLKDQFLAAQRDKMDALAAKLGRDAMTRREWVLATREVIKGTFVDLYALSKGGRGHMTQSDFGRLGAMVKAQYTELQKFEAAIRDGKMSQAQIAYRAKLYVNAAKQAFAEGGRAGAKDAGEDEERRVLSAAEHCPDCVAYANLGWQPIGTLPRIGESVCRVNCKCSFQFRKRTSQLSARQGDVLWAAML